MLRSRNFTFTWNNYPTDHHDTLCAIKSTQYIVYGKEVGEECGTPHLQGTVIFKHQKTEPQVRKLMQGCHIEVCQHLHKSIIYCKKDKDFTEWGNPPKTQQQKGEGEQERWRNIRIACEEGRFDDIEEKVRFNQYKACEHFRQKGLESQILPDTECQMEWYWGESRTGKSRKARVENPQAYIKSETGWWNGYTDQECVIIEDVDMSFEKLGRMLKEMGDRYPFRANFKNGGERMIRPKKIIITSNYEIRDIWSDERMYIPLMKRFKCTEFKLLKRGSGRSASPPYLPQTHDP